MTGRVYFGGAELGRIEIATKEISVIHRLNAAHLGVIKLSPDPEISISPRQRVKDNAANMSMFRAKKLDLGCFVKARTIRDHTKRKVFEEHETERYILFPQLKKPLEMRRLDARNWALDG